MPKNFTLTPNICNVRENKDEEKVYWKRKIPVKSAHLISGSEDRTIKYWSLNLDGCGGETCLKTIKAHTLCVQCILILPSGIMVTGSFGRSIKIWNSNAECIATLIGHNSSVHSLAYLNENLIISGSNDRSIKLWNLEKRECILTMHGHKFWVSCLLILPNGELASGSADKTIKLWNINTGKCTQTLYGHTNCITSLISSPKNELISAASDKTIKIWCLSSKKCKRTLLGHKNGIECMTIFNDGCTIVTGSTDKTIKIWDYLKGRCLKTLRENFELTNSVRADSNYVSSLIVVPYTGELVSSSSNGAIKVWDLNKGLCVNSFYGHRSEITCLAF
jgi:WD40 repeat protein